MMAADSMGQRQDNVSDIVTICICFLVLCSVFFSFRMYNVSCAEKDDSSDLRFHRNSVFFFVEYSVSEKSFLVIYHFAAVVISITHQCVIFQKRRTSRISECEAKNPNEYRRESMWTLQEKLT